MRFDLRCSADPVRYRLVLKLILRPLFLQVTGEEEIPDGAVAVLTPDAPDVLSHVSVRARNMRVLFATCHEKEPLEQIKVLAGKQLSLSTTAAGAVTWAEGHANGGNGNGSNSHSNGNGKALKISVPQWNGRCVLAGRFEYLSGTACASCCLDDLPWAAAKA